MAKLHFNKDHKIDDFTFIIARKDFYKFGAVKAEDVNYKSNFNGPDEISFRVYKTDVSLDVWDRINDYNVIIIPELGDDGYFEITIELNEEVAVYKSVTGTALAEAELSHVNIYNYQVNTEEEMEYDDWDPNYVCRFYRTLPDPSSPDYNKIKRASLLHRLLDKVPNYTIDHVDQTLLELTEWYQFSWDDKDLYRILSGDVAEQYHVLFIFNSSNRTISAYDLYSVCQNDNCDYRVRMLNDRNVTTRYRGDFQRTCPKCGSSNITPGYGKFTKIIVSKDNLMTAATVRSNKDSLYNCFKVKGGDDYINETLKNQNPNGSDYIYQFSAEQKAEMPTNLVNKLEQYDTEYDKYYYGNASENKGIYTFTANEKTQFDNLVTFISTRFSEDTISDIQNLKRTYTGYQALSALYYDTKDLEAFFEYAMAPDVETNNDSLAQTKALLTAANLSPVAVTDASQAVQASVESAIKQSADCIINTALYALTINTTSWTRATSKATNGTWIGTITIETIEYRNTEEAAEHTTTTNSLTLVVNSDVTTYVKQQIEKLISRKEAQILPLIDMTPVKSGQDSTALQNQFKEQLHYYSLDILNTIVASCFRDALSIIEQNSNKINSLYWDIYKKRLKYIEAEVVTRTAQVNFLNKLLEKIEKYRETTRKRLNFESYLGAALWEMFCNYRREYTYSNDNYISDDIENNNAETVRRAGELLEEAQKELYKASHLQFEVTGSLNNLLSLPQFASIVDDFEVGNWIRMQVDDQIYNLRLLDYSINFSSIQDISVDFSTVEKIWTGASDIQAVLKSAGSIAGSYSIVQQQVKHYTKPVKVMRDWVREGLKATQTRFVDDSATQEILIDSSGIYGRAYDEITGTYDAHQWKGNKNGIYFTSDNWDSLHTGIGAFTYPDPENNGQMIDAYGVIANTVVGNLFLGENLKIYSDNLRTTIDGDGFRISNGNGSVVLNPNATNIFQITNNNNVPTFYANSNGNVTMARGVIGGWSITPSNIRKDVVMDGVTYTPVLQAPETFETAEDLKKLAFGVMVDDGNTLTYPFIVRYDGSLTATDAKITGDITATSLTLTGNASIPTSKIDGINVYVKKDGTISGTEDGAARSFKVSSQGLLTASNAIISGQIIATSGTIGGWTIDATTISKSATLSGSTYTATMQSPNTVSANSGAFFISKETNGTTTYPFVVHYDGSVTATEANIRGEIHATEGDIGPWSIISSAIYRNNSTHGNANGMYFGTSGLSIKDKFIVDQNGNVTLGSELVLRESSTDTTWITFKDSNNATSASIMNNGGLFEIDSNTIVLETKEGVNLSVTPSNSNLSSQMRLGYGSAGLLATYKSGLPSKTYGVTVLANSLTSGDVIVYGTLISNDKIQADGAIYTNSKTAASDGMAGIVLGTTGYVYLVGATPGLNFYFNNSSTITSSIMETASGKIAISNNLEVGGKISSGSINTSGAVYTGGKTAYNDGHAGVGVMGGGFVDICHASAGGAVRFYYNQATSNTAKIEESASGEIRVTASNGFIVGSVYDKTTSGAANVIVLSGGLLMRTASSSKRYKHDIQELKDYKGILDIPVVSFKYNEGYLSNDDRRYGKDVPGFIAEDVNKYYPSAVEWANEKVEDWNVRYIVPPMLAVLQDHNGKIAKLERENEELREELKALKQNIVQ